MSRIIGRNSPLVWDLEPCVPAVQAMHWTIPALWTVWLAWRLDICYQTSRPLKYDLRPPRCWIWRLKHFFFGSLLFLGQVCRVDTAAILSSNCNFHHDPSSLVKWALLFMRIPNMPLFKLFHMFPWSYLDFQDSSSFSNNKLSLLFSSGRSFIFFIKAAK